MRRLCPAARPLPKRRNIRAPVSGVIEAIDSFLVGLAAIEAGAGRRHKDDLIGYGSGFIFLAKVGDRVEKGQACVTVHSDRPERTPDVLRRLGDAIRIGPGPAAAPKLIQYLVDKDGVHPWTHAG